MAEKISKEPVWIKGVGVASGTANLSKREQFMGLESAKLAASQAYAMAKIRDPKRAFDIAEVHDCFTIAEIMAYEDLSFTERGMGVELIKDQQTYKGGKIPTNLSGGLKAKGHPIGATGLSMICEVSKQLNSKIKGERQADIRKGLGLVHNIGGTGHYAYVTILSIEKNGD